MDEKQKPSEKAKKQAGWGCLIIVIFFILVSIISNNTDNKKTPSQKIDPTSITITKNTSYKEVLPIKDLSTGVAKRIEATIAIPRGRTYGEVRNTLQRAAKEIGERETFDAMVVNGFGDGDKYRHGSYTAGRAILAPNGKWEDAAKSTPKSISVELGVLYFAEDKTAAVPQENDMVILVSKNNSMIKVSKNRDSWVDEDIIAKFPVGTKAIILEKYEEALSPSYKFVRYMIKVNNTTGWVFGENVSNDNK